MLATRCATSAPAMAGGRTAQTTVGPEAPQGYAEQMGSNERSADPLYLRANSSFVTTV